MKEETEEKGERCSFIKKKRALPCGHAKTHNISHLRSPRVIGTLAVQQSRSRVTHLKHLSPTPKSSTLYTENSELARTPHNNLLLIVLLSSARLELQNEPSIVVQLLQQAIVILQIISLLFTTSSPPFTTQQKIRASLSREKHDTCIRRVHTF
jgi:hypothetical protein